MDTFDELFARSSEPVVLDGGLGTTLESNSSLSIAGTALWSAQALVEDPESIVRVHLAFLRAGAQVISTSTYQCSDMTFRRAGYMPCTAANLMRSAVMLAANARMEFCASHHDEAGRAFGVKIALSLGPFGAALSPTQEYGGFYPPPYGPRAYSASSENVNYFCCSEDEAELKTKAERALMEFHLERLAIFALDDKIWGEVDCVAFETIPLTREIRAIKQAVHELSKELAERGKMMKPWWISLVFPDGQFPEQLANAERVKPEDAVQAILEGSEGFARPSAVGVNCTSIDHLPEILRAMEEVVRQRQFVQTKPWLVLYPNNEKYNTTSRTWKKTTESESWANRLAGIVKGIQRDVWGGVVVGGCCRAGPKEIEMLVRQL